MSEQKKNNELDKLLISWIKFKHSQIEASLTTRIGLHGYSINDIQSGVIKFFTETTETKKKNHQIVNYYIQTPDLRKIKVLKIQIGENEISLH